MEISFRSVEAAGRGIALHETLTLPRIAEENAQVEEIGPIQADVHASAESHICRVHGTLRTTVTYQCSRCLEQMNADIAPPFDESFTDRPDQADDEVHFVADDDIVLDPYIEETINLALEVFPVCKEDCKGLCPVCGCNLNHAACQCDTRAPDPRFAALADLLSDDESQ